ncbi:unnamed protein product [Rhizophagus irregularis]|nr:unnamed protein product [Rhizophagus irregularis]
MELTKKLNYDSFDPTPKLKSSPIPISFVSFNESDLNCIHMHCGDSYADTTIGNQYYCKKCLSYYLANITDNNLYLDVYLLMENLECSEHEISMTNKSQNIQECCRNCLGIFCFKQIPNRSYFNNRGSYNKSFKNVIESEKNCKLCGKSMYQGTEKKFTLCSDCYSISSEYVESTLTKKPITILYLPWWLNINSCNSCYISLIFTSDCQKYCENCFTFYIGCRYCLTTNIVFGITNQSQCKKCKRISSIIYNISGNSVLDDFLINSRLEIHNQLRLAEFTDKIKNIGNYFIPYELFYSIYKKFFVNNSKAEISMEWIPYSQFTNVKEIARGGFGIIYLATWLDGPIIGYDRKRSSSNETVILKRFKNSQDISKYFLNELKSNQSCYKFKHHIIRTYGFTRDPEFDDHVLVMQYASGGDLHNWMRENFAEITWNKEKLGILWQISEGLDTIHKAEFIHRDFHSGNILANLSNAKKHRWQIADLGLSQPANNASNNEIYGVIPYIAPEIFKGSSFSKESDVYCMGMIMWELTTGCKPFANVEHDIDLIYRILDGERPKITEDTPECFIKLMESCWDSDPEKRPSITEVRKTLSMWYHTNKILNHLIKQK